MIEEFERQIKAVREPNTVDAYVQGAKRFERFLGGTFDAVTPNTMSDFVVHLVEGGLAPPSVHLYKAGATQYLNWLRLRGMTIPEQAKPMMPRIKEKIIGILDDDLLTKFMGVAKTIRDPYRTALSLLPLTGLRVGEMGALRLKDVLVRPPWGYVFILHNTKGRCDRTVPVLKSGTAILKTYITNVRPALPGDVWLFPSRRGTHIHTDSLELYMRQVKKTMGVLNLTPHTLRHIYATILERSGVSDLKIMQIMGHKNLQTTRRYVHLTAEDLASDLDRVKTPWADEGDES